MEQIIDARMRLPMSMRPEPYQVAPPEMMGRYDSVLNVSERNKLGYDDLLRDMGLAGIGHAILHAEYEAGDGVDEMNETIANLVNTNGSLFSGFGSVSLSSHNIMKMRRQVDSVSKMGLVGLNLQPAFLGYDIDSAELYPVYAAACERNLTVAVHTGINYARSKPMEGEHPLRLDRVASDFPDLRLIACHAAWPWVDDIVAVARRHPTVYLEFGGLAPKYVGQSNTGWGTARKMLDNLLMEQVLFASDWPTFEPVRGVTEWKEMGLPDDALAALLGGNAAALIRDSGRSK